MPEIDSSIYNKLNSGRQPGLGDMSPGQILDLANKSIDYQTRLGVNNAFRQAADPGSPTGFDPNKLQRAVTDPNSGVVLSPEHAEAIYNLNNKALEFKSKQNASVQDFLGTLANDPSMTADKAYAMALRHSANTGISPSFYINLLRGAPNNPAAFHDYLTNVQNSAIGAAGTAERVAGPPVQSGPNAGAPTTLSKGQANFAGPNAGGGGLPTGTPPGTEESAKLYQNDQARAGNFQSDIFPWQQALSKLNQLGPAGTGPGTRDRNKLMSYINTLAPDVAKRLGIDNSTIAAYDEANKYLTQATQQRAGALGADTNEKLAVTISGNPNVDINHLAATDVTKMAIAYRRLEHLQAMEAAKSGPVGYSNAKATSANKYDPRALSLDLANPDQIRQLDKSLKGPEREKFNRTLRLSKQYGLLNAGQ